MHRTRRSGLVLLAGAALGLAALPAAAPAAEPGARVKVNAVPAALKRQWERVAEAMYGEVPSATRAMQTRLSMQPGLELDEKAPEVLVTVQSLEHQDGERGTDPYTGKPTLQHLYIGRGTIDLGGQHLPLLVRHEFVEGPSALRMDTVEYGNLANEMALKAAEIVFEHLDTLRPDRSQSGLHHIDLKVSAVEPNSPAEKAGLQPKDRIKRIDAQKSGGKMADRIHDWWMEPAGTKVALEIERNKQRQTVELVLQPRSAWDAAPAASR